MTAKYKIITRVQTGVRIEKRLLKVLMVVAELFGVLPFGYASRFCDCALSVQEQAFDIFKTQSMPVFPTLRARNCVSGDI